MNVYAPWLIILKKKKCIPKPVVLLDYRNDKKFNLVYGRYVPHVPHHYVP